jgi:hypothetical protein
MVIVSNIVIAILHDTGKNEHTRVTFTNHYDHVNGHSYNRRPWHILWYIYTVFNLYVASCSTFINEYSDIKKTNPVEYKTDLFVYNFTRK